MSYRIAVKMEYFLHCRGSIFIINIIDELTVI